MRWQWTAVFAGLLLGARLAVAGEVVHLDLNGPWNLTRAGQPEPTPAVVPGCVHLDLLAAKQIADPFFRDNQKSLQWIGDVAWTYSRTFAITADKLDRQHVLLRCEGLDTVAAISVNGRAVARTENMFRTYEFDVKPFLQPGSNSIEVTFWPVAGYIKTFVANAVGMSSIKGMSNVRKAPYSNGWDFGPKFLTCGIYKKIELLAFDQGRLTHVAVTTHLDHAGGAWCGVEAFVDGDQPLQVDMALSLKGTQVATGTIGLGANSNVCRLNVPRPQLWWPHGRGAQPLYDLVVHLKDAKANVIDSRSIRVGLREIELLPKTADRPLRLKVNGREIFAKGTNWIPADMFAPRVTTAKLRRYVADAAAVNMNMIRCWGGGYYEEDAFYDACDEFGLLVWSEFKFACASYPVNVPAFVTNVKAEVTDQVNRLRNHPCIAVWCGNNEVLSLITGFKILKQKDYDVLFHDVIGAQVNALMPGANYVGGSPEAGDEHNWWVWHVGANFEKYLESHGWMTEFGFQSFPCPATVESYTDLGDRDSVLSPVMKAHQHNGNRRGNEMIVDMMGRYFQPPKDFESTLWLSQINQAYGVTMGIEHWRGDWPRSSGALVWQYDDCWPGATWSSVDYFGRWKALHYKLRDAFAPLMVTGFYNAFSGEVRTIVCGDSPVPCDCALRWRLTDTEGKLISNGETPVQIPAGTASVPGPDLKLADSIATTGRKHALLWLDLWTDGQVVSEKVLGFVRPKDIALQNPFLRSRITQTPEGFDVAITAAAPALWAWLDLTEDPDARFSDNFTAVSTHRPWHVLVTPSKAMTIDQFSTRLRVRSLFDTYDSKRVAQTVVMPGVDGSFLATADQADIIGNSTRLEPGHPSNIGAWSDAGDHLEWTIATKQPGVYRVVADVACPGGTAGSTIELRAGRTSVTGTVLPTRSWYDYQKLDLGLLKVDTAGTMILTVRAVAMPHGNVMNLRSISLQPVAP